MRDGWIETTLGEVSESSWGNTEITKSKYVPTGFLAFSASGADGFLDWFEHDTSAVILSAIGAQCGKTWFASGRWTAIKNTIWLKSNGVSLSDKYLFYLSNTEHFWQIRGQAQPFISLGDVKKKKLMLPPLAEQKRIVHLISSVDSYIEALQQQVDKARKSRNAVLHELLTKGGDGWVETKLGEICEIYQPKTIAKSLMNDSGNYIVYGANGPIGRFDEYNHENSEVVVTCRGATCGTVNKTPQKTWITGNAMVIKPKNDSLLRDFLFFSLTSYVDLRSCISGSAQPQITREGLSPQKILIPPLTEQKRIVEIISVFDNQIEALDSTIAKTKNLRSALLSDLLSGNHEIPTTYDKLIGAA